VVVGTWCSAARSVQPAAAPAQGGRPSTARHPASNDAAPCTRVRRRALAHCSCAALPGTAGNSRRTCCIPGTTRAEHCRQPVPAAAPAAVAALTRFSLAGGAKKGKLGCREHQQWRPARVRRRVAGPPSLRAPRCTAKHYSCDAGCCISVWGSWLPPVRQTQSRNQRTTECSPHGPTGPDGGCLQSQQHNWVPKQSKRRLWGSSCCPAPASAGGTPHTAPRAGRGSRQHRAAPPPRALLLAARGCPSLPGRLCQLQQPASQTTRPPPCYPAICRAACRGGPPPSARRHAPCPVCRQPRCRPAPREEQRAAMPWSRACVAHRLRWAAGSAHQGGPPARIAAAASL